MSDTRVPMPAPMDSFKVTATLLRPHWTCSVSNRGHTCSRWYRRCWATSRCRTSRLPGGPAAPAEVRAAGAARSASAAAAGQAQTAGGSGAGQPGAEARPVWRRRRRQRRQTWSAAAAPCARLQRVACAAWGPVPPRGRLAGCSGRAGPGPCTVRRIWKAPAPCARAGCWPGTPWPVRAKL